MFGSFIIVIFSGCLSGPNPADLDDPSPGADAAPFLDYVPIEPDVAMVLEEFDAFLAAAEGVEIHTRIVKPEGEGPFPVIVQFTPYTAPGTNVVLNGVEPLHGTSTPLFSIGPPGGGFVQEFVRRGYAFAFADVRGTGDSTGCLDLRGDGDIADATHLIEYLGTQPWSNGNVGFIGASYPGSEAHMAGLAAAIHGAPHLKAVVPVVASTSFYHYHHNDGVPYNGQHSLGGTNVGYTQNALFPTASVQNQNYGPRYAEEVALCDYADNMFTHGGLDQTGAYYEWWQERNLRERAGLSPVPVLMAQGLADWNVKPDHIATWFNDLTVQKTLIAGQWGHQYPRSVSDECETFVASATQVCDPGVPYGDWWHYVNAFFDTHLKEVDTGMFDSDVAWVQDNEGAWHRSANWPLRSSERNEFVLHLSDHRILEESPIEDDDYRETWTACGRDQFNMGQAQLTVVEGQISDCYQEGANSEVVFNSEPLASDMIISGVPVLNLTLSSTAATAHIVAILDVLDAEGNVVDHAVNYADGSRQNYGYLNPTYRYGLENPAPVPVNDAYVVSVDFYPQEDVLRAGQTLRLTIRSVDDGRTIEAFEQGEHTIVLGPDNENTLTLPLRPVALQGVRLPEPLAS